jgi:carboxyl-terminal processing protease
MFKCSRRYLFEKIKKMKYFLSTFFLFLGLNLVLAKPIKPFTDPKKENKILEIVFNTLKNKHFISKKIDDNFSKKVFKTYLDSLDRNKLFFLESDFNEFKKYETKLDDQIKKNDLMFFFMTYDRLMMRMREGKDLYLNVIKNNIDFNENDEKSFDLLSGDNSVSNKNFKKTKSEQSKLWANYIKTNIVNEALLGNSGFFSKKENISNTDMIDVEIENINQNIALELESTLVNFNNISRDLILEYFINAIVVQFDVHSKYYAPPTRDKYLINQTGRLEGLGITVYLVNNFVQIKKLAFGGPASKIKKLAIDDVVLKVGQENDEPVNVVGFNIHDVVKLFRGKSGTNVKLTLKKPDGTIYEVTVKRGIVSSNDTYIKSCLVEKNKINYAVLSFPRFYSDFDDDGVRNATDDFETELQVLKQSNVQGVIIDMRNNGGGSVEAAVKILGNFITKNPVIQLKDKEGKINLLSSENENINWDKSVVLLVNSESASATEIFATAFKDFNIGIVIGEQTFGKATVQEFIDLNSFIFKKSENIDYGALKITTNKFYKTNGKSTQKTGIIPDIIFSTLPRKRENLILNALNNDEVKPIESVLINKPDFFNKIIKQSQSRTNGNEKFQLFTKNSQNKYEFEKKVLELKTLNKKKLKTQINELILKYDALKYDNYSSDLVFKSTTGDIKLLKSKQYLLQKRKQWLDELPLDLQIEEGINILEDMYILK